MTRKKHKSPIRHRVKSHMRKGKRVQSYMRGHGASIQNRKTRKTKTSKPRELRKYTVELTYEDGKKETDKSIGYSVTEALIDAKLNRKRKNVRVVKAVITNSELIDVMQEITSKGARVARTAAGVIDTVQDDEPDRYDVEHEWR